MSCKICFLILFSLLGSLLNLGINELITSFLKKKIKKHKKAIEELSSLLLLSFSSGFLEILIYSSSFLIGRPEIIFLWIGVKTALKWDRKRNKDIDDDDEKFRGLYYRFLIGNALSIIFSYSIACIIKGQLIVFN